LPGRLCLMVVAIGRETLYFYPFPVNATLRPHSMSMPPSAHPMVITSAWLAAGMTSRARRPQPDMSAG